MHFFFATGRDEDGNNPKKDVIEKLQPIYFVDDLLDNFTDIPSHIHKVWIDYKKADSPNVGRVEEGLHNSAHGTLLDFATMLVEQNLKPSRFKP